MPRLMSVENKNARSAFEGAIGELDDALLRKSFELNFFAHQNAAQNAVRIFKAQGTGGVLLFNTSNWKTPQTVTLTGLPDCVNDGDVAYQLITAKSESATVAWVTSVFRSAFPRCW